MKTEDKCYWYFRQKNSLKTNDKPQYIARKKLIKTNSPPFKTGNLKNISNNSNFKHTHHSPLTT